MADSAQQPPSEGAFVDGDKTKLDGLITADTANVAAAGALMDSEVTNLADVKAFDTSDYATAAQGTLADSATQPGDLATVATSGDYDDLSNKPSLATYAPLASPALTGNPTAPTQSANDNSTKIASTAYVDAASGGGTVTTSGLMTFPNGGMVSWTHGLGTVPAGGKFGAYAVWKGGTDNGWEDGDRIQLSTMFEAGVIYADATQVHFACHTANDYKVGRGDGSNRNLSLSSTVADVVLWVEE